MAVAPLVSPSPSPSSDPSPSPSSEPSVFCLSFNQDHSCIASGTSSGFRIFSSDPLSELFRREFNSSAPSGGGRLSFVRRVGSGGGDAAAAAAAGAASAARAGSSSGDGFTIVEMLFRSNVLALVSPRYSSNKVIVWDDYQGHCIGELLFRSEVRAVRLRRDRIVVVLEHKIHLYSFPDLRLVHQVETLANPRGLCTLSSASGSCIMACPGLNRGEVRVELYGNKRTKFLQAHTSDLACISLCSNGALLATASTKGTLIRIFNTADGYTLQELRRGTDRADIYSLAFSSNSHWLAVSSDKGTIHVFCLNEPWSSCEDGKNADGFHMSSSGTNRFPSSLSSGLSSSISSGLKIARSSLMSLARSNTSSSLSFMKGVLPKYFSSEWSFAQFRLPEDTHAIVVFGSQRNTVVVLCSNGSYYKCSFDLSRGGEMVLEETSRL